jgi:hypothetical protein
MERPCYMPLQKRRHLYLQRRSADEPVPCTRLQTRRGLFPGRHFRSERNIRHGRGKAPLAFGAPVLVGKEMFRIVPTPRPVSEVFHGDSETVHQWTSVWLVAEFYANV